MKIKKGQMAEYRRKLGEAWPELTGFLDRDRISNFSIWGCGRLIFGYCESEGGSNIHDTVTVLADKLGDTFEWVSVPGEEMRLMYKKIGIIREKKELIRHRVFMAKLKPGCEEIYKARHDALSAAGEAGPDPGPDSNFTIWSAGGYIFGYDEIDITMETQEPEEAHAASMEWEKRQLEIMDWVTNDMDWLTGEYHPPCVRLAWHG